MCVSWQPKRANNFTSNENTYEKPVIGIWSDDRLTVSPSRLRTKRFPPLFVFSIIMQCLINVIKPEKKNKRNMD